MKYLPLGLVFAAATLRGADPTLPQFNSSDIGHPPLSLGDVGKAAKGPLQFGNSPLTLDDLATGGKLLGPDSKPSIAKLTPPPPRFSQKSGPGKMPILEPNPSIDHKIVLKEPDPGIDFKMLIKPTERDEPDKGPAK